MVACQSRSAPPLSVNSGRKDNPCDSKLKTALLRCLGLATPYIAPRNEVFIGATEINREISRRGGTSEPPPNETNNCGGPSTSNSERLNEDLPGGFVCCICMRSFTTKIGLGMHRKRTHPVEYNEDIVVERRKPRWSEEELRLLAMEEAMAPAGIKAMNTYLLERIGATRTLEAIKGARKRANYKEMLVECRDRLLDRMVERVLEEPEISGQTQKVDADHSTGERRAPLGEWRTAKEWLEFKLDDIIPEMNGGIWIRAAICRLMEGASPDGCLEQWWKGLFPDLVEIGSCRRTRAAILNKDSSKRRARRKEYRRMQTLWSKNMSKAAKKILDGDADAVPHPSLAEQIAFWGPVFESGSTTDDRSHDCGQRRPLLEDLWEPISEGEVINIKLPSASAPGLDGLTVRRWMTEVPAIIRAAILNIFMATGRVPSRFRDSRTILIPKSCDHQEPAYYRPISIASVVLRHFHKILAVRLSRHDIIDVRQRAFISTDGCAENVAILSALLFDARTKFRQVHVVTLDVQKAFDTVTHEGIYAILRKSGIPPPMIEYMRTIYSTAATRLEVDGQLSSAIYPGRGVRQGDPLSPIVFNLTMNEVLAAMPDHVGYQLGDRTVGALAFADDLVIIGSTLRGTQLSLDRTVIALRQFGLRLAPQKCAAFSLVPSGKDKKMKVLTEEQFIVNGHGIPQRGVLQAVRYLGVQIGAGGPVPLRSQISCMLDRIRRAPLKPQQRLKILTTYLIPRFIHGLVLGRTSHGALRRMDVSIRSAVRQWLRLPADVPRAFFHTSVREGGLGIMSFESAIPRMALARLSRLKSSVYQLADWAGSSDWAQRKVKWCELAKKKDEDWSKELYRSVDSFELREASKVSSSTGWLCDPAVHIPSSDWLNYVKVWVNALPSRVRTTRGTRRAQQNTQCRGGCAVQETTAHIIQQCFRTHGGRIMRHDAVAAVLAQELDRAGYKVKREHLFRTQTGARKPDILAAKGDSGYVLDVQIVTGTRSLTEAHKRKRQYYAGNSDLMEMIAQMLQVDKQRITVSTATLTWRGIWAAESANVLSSVGLSRALMNGITTRVLMGSFMNFRRFNMTTMMYKGRSHTTMSGWGPPQ